MSRLTHHQIARLPVIRALIRQARNGIAQYRFRKEFNEFKNNSLSDRFLLRWEDRKPCLNDRTSSTQFDRHYVYHTAWAARVLARTKPTQHVDISSYLYFATLVSAFVPVRFYDYRPAQVVLPGLETGFADLNALPFADGSVDSLSCMHVVEHVGLGRYGDALDPNGDLKAIKELARVLAPGGHLLFVVPVGQPRVMFNAHRIYGYDQVIEAFEGLHVEEFNLIQQQGNDPPIQGATAEQVAAEQYGCGCFWFRKLGDGN